MKAKIILLTFVITALFSQSCENYLEEELVSDVSAVTYYSTPQGWEDAVRATYASMKSFWGVEMGFTMTVFGTDVYTNGADGGYKPINRYDVELSPNQELVTETWNLFYRGINQANAVINRAEEIEDLEEEVKNQRIAEVKFLRALYYFTLTRTYGDIHLSLEETEEVEITANRTPAAEIYSQAIIPDLEDAIAILPDAQDDLGRATKPAAEFLLGQALLTRSYQPYAEGDDAARAEASFTSVIENYGFELAESYYELFGNNEAGVPTGIGTFEDNKEYIFMVQNAKSQVDPRIDDNGNRGHLYFLFEYDVRPGMTRDIENGRPWKRFRPTPFGLSLFNRDIDRRYDETFKHAWIANNEATIPTWTQEEAAFIPAGKSVGDPKFEVGDTAVYIPGPGRDARWGPDQQARAPYLVITTDEYNEKLFPSLNKWIDNTRPDRQHEPGQRDFALMRLGDAYLLRAEAKFQQGNLPGAAEDINVIRTRAAQPEREAEMQITAADVTLDFILDERARELLGEGMRWFDLVRTGKLVERVKLHNPEAAPNIQEYHQVRPIPQDQIDRTEGGYPQNPGYPGVEG